MTNTVKTLEQQANVDKSEIRRLKADVEDKQNELENTLKQQKAHMEEVTYQKEQEKEEALQQTKGEFEQ